MQFGEWLYQQRTARGWSLKTLATAMQATGLTTASPQYIQQVERGEINADKMGRDKLTALATVLGLTVDAMLHAAGQRPVTPAADLAALEAGDVTDPELAAIAAELERLPDEGREQVLNFARFMAAQYERAQQPHQRRPRRRPAAGEPDLTDEHPPAGNPAPHLATP